MCLSIFYVCVLCLDVFFFILDVSLGCMCVFSVLFLCVRCLCVCDLSLYVPFDIVCVCSVSVCVSLYSSCVSR